MDGFLNVYKEPGMTSHDVVARLRRGLRLKKVGHAGTLDPMATGVLVICLGRATRLADYVGRSRKTYVTEVAFGRATDTQDATGLTTHVGDASALNRDRVLSLLHRFRGEIAQVPPMVSARHHQGVRLYELARRGETVEREARPVTIHRLELLEFREGLEPTARLEVECSAGTYIRTLAHDLGEAAGCGAHMASLERVRVGSFDAADSLPIAEVLAAGERGDLAGRVLPMLAAVRGLRLRLLTAAEVERVSHGHSVADDTDGGAEGEEVALAREGEGSGTPELVALARRRESPEGPRLRPFKVLIDAPVPAAREPAGERP